MLPKPPKDSITVILNAYSRPEAYPFQLGAINNQTVQPRHIWTWQNRAPKKELHFLRPPKSVLVNSSFNFLFHGRFALGLLAQGRTEYLAFLDDDTIPGKRWFENCLACMKQRPGLMVGSGHCLLPPDQDQKGRHWVGWRGPNEQITEVDYGGHAWFMRTEWLRLFWAFEPVTLENGEDIQMSAALQYLGGIPTYVPPHPLNNKDLWCNTIGWHFGRTKYAAHKNPAGGETVKEWRAFRRQIELELIEKGRWQPMYMRERS